MKTIPTSFNQLRYAPDSITENKSNLTAIGVLQQTRAFMPPVQFLTIPRRSGFRTDLLERATFHCALFWGNTTHTQDAFRTFHFVSFIQVSVSYKATLSLQ